MRLGTLLLRDAVITLSQLEAALRAQVLYGGKLGTNLVELGHLDVNTLGRYLSKILDLPVATVDKFEKVKTDVLEIIGANRADRYSAFPLGFEQGQPSRLGVVFLDPNDRHSVRQLEAEIDYEVQPYCASELRILYYLERRYNLARRARFLRPHREGAPRGERRRTLPPTNAAAPPVRLEPRVEEPAEEVVESAPALTELEVHRLIEESTGREAIGSAIARFGEGRMALCSVFIARSGSAVGWHSHPACDGFGDLSVGLTAASSLQASFDCRGPYFGPPTIPVERQIWKVVGVREPAEVAAVPVSVAKRVVNLIYAFSPGGQPIPKELGDALLRIADSASEAYQRLISAAKSKK